MAGFDLAQHEILVDQIVRNASPARLYEDAISREKAAIATNGALIIRSGKKTGRSPTDKRIVDDPESRAHIWWGNVNIKLDEQSFVINRERAIDYLNTQPTSTSSTASPAGTRRYRLKVRVICARAVSRAVHAQHADPPDAATSSPTSASPTT